MYMILHLPMICNSKFTYLLQKSIHKYILAIKGGLPMPAMLNALVLPKKCGSHVIEILTNRSIKTLFKQRFNGVLYTLGGQIATSVNMPTNSNRI